MLCGGEKVGCDPSHKVTCVESLQPNDDEATAFRGGVDSPDQLQGSTRQARKPAGQPARRRRYSGAVAAWAWW